MSVMGWSNVIQLPKYHQNKLQLNKTFLNVVRIHFYKLLPICLSVFLRDGAKKSISHMRTEEKAGPVFAAYLSLHVSVHICLSYLLFVALVMRANTVLLQLLTITLCFCTLLC